MGTFEVDNFRRIENCKSAQSKKIDCLHAVFIRYIGFKDLSSKKVHEDMVAALGKGAPFYSMVKKWAAEFKRGRESLKDDPPSWKGGHWSIPW